MSWRYQPVTFIETIAGVDETVYQLCEVYLDDAGKLDKWTDPPGICPTGEENLSSLTQDLTRMLVDAYCWAPVKFADLKPGMKFRRRATMKQREALATFVEMIGHNLSEATKERVK